MSKLDMTSTVLRDLHPIAAPLFTELARQLEQLWLEDKCPICFKPYVGYRPPIQQQELTQVRPPVTNVAPWHSPHQYGLAVQFKAWRRTGYYSHDDFSTVRWVAEEVGLRVPLSWDMSQVVHPIWIDVHLLLNTKR